MEKSEDSTSGHFRGSLPKPPRNWEGLRTKVGLLKSLPDRNRIVEEIEAFFLERQLGMIDPSSVEMEKRKVECRDYLLLRLVICEGLDQLKSPFADLEYVIDETAKYLDLLGVNVEKEPDLETINRLEKLLDSPKFRQRESSSDIGHRAISLGLRVKELSPPPSNSSPVEITDRASPVKILKDSAERRQAIREFEFGVQYARESK